jgi:hypothetical protein
MKNRVNHNPVLIIKPGKWILWTRMRERMMMGMRIWIMEEDRDADYYDDIGWRRRLL